MNFFGVGPAEAGLVFVIALIVVGPQRFPEIMRQAGRWYRVARAYSNEVMQDVRSAVDDIEREVKAETDDLKSVREFADLGADLKAAQKDAEDIGREADNVLRDRPAASPNATTPQTAEEAKRSLRPSQRGTATPAASNRDAEAVPPIEQAAQPLAESASEPAAQATEAPAPATSNFDPFSKKPAKKGPVLIRRESATTEGDERTS
ncbi:MAG: hypothetical protein DWG80_01960 [Chloroflexi bacterium]|nr:hypothetical protein [Chloroflexota bacterium]